MEIYEISLPEYQVDHEPDHERIGAKVDELIKSRFMGQDILIRCLSSCEHPGKSRDEIVDIISEKGHDRYDPHRKGDRYENNENRTIDIFALPFSVSAHSQMFSAFTWPFYHWGKERSGEPVRIDIVIIYDQEKLAPVGYTYAGREHEGVKSDGFVFKDQKNRRSAVKAILKIL
jgi:hypothetical protein